MLWLGGPVLEGRRQALIDHVSMSDAADEVAADIDPDGDEALAAYNRMLGRLNNDQAPEQTGNS